VVANYRLYLFDKRGSIQAREDFEAAHDQDATIASEIVCRACSDRCGGFSLWLGRQLVVECGPLEDGIVDDPLAAPTRVQQIALTIEEKLRSSDWSVARSERLTAEMEQLRASVAKRSAES
jgi:hypothetical protein